MNKKNIQTDTISLASLIAFRKAEKRLSKYESIAMKKADLTFGQFIVLEILFNKGALTISEIIEGVLTTSGNITVVIKNLKRDNFVEQIINPKDKRSSLICLTDKGSELISSVLPDHFKNIEDSLSDLTREEKKQLINLVNKIK